MRRIINLALNVANRFGPAGALIVAGRLSYLLLFFVLARRAPAEQFGMFTVTMATCQLLGMGATLGAAPTSQAIIAPALAKGRGRVARRYVEYAVVATAAGSLLIAAAATIFGHFTPRPDTARLAMAVALLGPVMAFSTLREFLARAFEQTFMAFAPRDVGWCLLLTGLTFCFAPVATHLVLSATLLLALVEGTAWFALWRTRIRSLPARRRGPIFGRKWISRSLALMTNYFGGLGFERIDVIALGALGDLAMAGVYGTANRLAPLISVSQRFVVPVLSPRVARALAARDHRALRTEILHGALAAMLIAAPGILVLGLFAGPILSLFGPRFVVGAPALRILAVAHFAIAIGSTFGVVTMMGAKPWRYAMAIWAALIPAAVAMPFVVPRFGIVGAAGVVTLGIVAYNAAMVVMALPHLRARTSDQAALVAERQAA